MGQVGQLGGRQGIVEDHEIRLQEIDLILQLAHLAAADIVSRILAGEVLAQLAHRLDVTGLAEPVQLGHAHLKGLRRHFPGNTGAGQHRPPGTLHKIILKHLIDNPNSLQI